ncbi:MAG: tetratricopeptide repeat protein [Pseudanabaena sp.]
MIETSSSLDLINQSELTKQAHNHYLESQYDLAEKLYQDSLTSENISKISYWYLGLSQLLQGKESDAQMTWLLAVEDEEVEQIDQYTEELSQVLDAEANRFAALECHQESLTIRNSLREINPYDLANLVSMILISIKLKTFTPEELINIGILDLLDSDEFTPITSELLLDLIQEVLTFKIPEPIILQFVEKICFAHIQYQEEIIEYLLRSSAHFVNYPNIAVDILENCLLRIDPNNAEAKLYAIDFNYQGDNEKSIATAKEFYALMLENNGKAIYKVLANQWLIKALIYKCNHWEEAAKVHQQCEQHFAELVNEGSQNLSLKEAAYYLQITGYYDPYFSDHPKEAHRIRQAVRQLAYQRIYTSERENIENYKKRLSIRKKVYIPNRPLRIGYISYFLKRHSVGFLARWLIQYHDRERFELYGYLGNYQENDVLQVWFEKQFLKTYHEKSYNPVDTANQIIQDGIDILIDLDSCTNAMTSGILALKPAPIQVTWLGWDAAGQPTVDYFIADPYVLPESAQEYYTEKIWRLPHTYLAVDGFEVSAPTIRRDLLNIPKDAVVYYSSQASMKRHPDTIRLQMRIIKRVANSYLLLKGFGDKSSLQEFFYRIAELEGVSKDRLIFLPVTNGEREHRANMGIADIVLDTYPYNGATHTMETLWMGIPIVTRVGEQFVARNSYTMMINAGITEGIAWTDDEYVDWGVKLGTDTELRQQVTWKLRQGRQTAPLWNSRQFTKDLEESYEQMWLHYLDSDDQTVDVDPERDRALFIAESEIQNTQGIVFAQKDKLPDAILSFQRAISLNPEHADAYYNLGISFSNIGDLEQAIVNFQTTIALNPNHANALYNLGLTYSRQGKLAEAIAYLSQALTLTPEDIETHLALGNIFFEQNKFSEALKCYQSALEIDPNSSSALCSIGATLGEQGKYQEAITTLHEAIAIDPDNAQVYCNLGHVFSKTKQLQEASECYRRALQIKPDFSDAFWNFNNDVLSNSENPLHDNYKLRREIADQFVEACHKNDKVRSLVNYITNYTQSGLADIAKAKLYELENYVLEHSNDLTKIEIEVLYNNFLFIISSIRDDISLNTNMYKFIGNLYSEKIIQTRTDYQPVNQQSRNYQPKFSNQDKSSLKIGFLSPHFARHPVGWCSLDVIRELSHLTPHIYLYNTGKIKPDDRTQMFEGVAKKYYWYDDQELHFQPNNTFAMRIERVVTDILQDELDILIDLDSVTIPLNTHILYRKLAPVCISWLGFDAPFVSSNNYTLCDHYTHPSTSDQYYLENLVRLPDSHMAIAGFEYVPINRDEQRSSLGILPEQIAYLFAAPGRKFNHDGAKACISILNQVPNSVLMHKGSGDHEVIRAIYHQECNDQGVDCDRVKFLPSYKTEEEHRSAYLLADIYLDSYPYNGGSHNLEALWLNLPVVTRVGHQSFSRMGYSFLQSVGIQEGIATTWEEYVDWGIKLGKDKSLRLSIQEKLIQSKRSETLAPLWNPKKLAKDMYILLESLVANAFPL